MIEVVTSVLTLTEVLCIPCVAAITNWLITTAGFFSMTSRNDTAGHRRNR